MGHVTGTWQPNFSPNFLLFFYSTFMINKWIPHPQYFCFCTKNKMVGPERRGQHTGVTMFKIFFVAHQRTALYTHVYTYVTFRGSLRNALKTTPFYLSTRQKKKLQFVSFFSLDSSIPFSFYFPCHPSRGNVDSRCSCNITCTYPILTNTHRKHVFASTIHPPPSLSILSHFG